MDIQNTDKLSILKTTIYSDKEKNEIIEYLNQLNETQLKTYLIAINHLGSSFNIYKSNGFKEWKKVNFKD
jgi:hypothetical protein